MSISRSWSIDPRRSAEGFLARQQRRALTAEEKTTVLKLMELQRHAMLMYTSCGWFFDELSGIETVQVLQYAGRAIQLAQELSGDDLEENFLVRLARAKSNLPEHGDGRIIYEKFVRPAMVNLAKVGAHYAIRSLFEPYAEEDRIYCFDVDREDYHTAETGKTKLAVGKACFTSRITQEVACLTFGVLHFGDHNLAGGVREYRGPESYQQLVQEIQACFSRANYPEVIRCLDKGFGKSIYSLQSLFRDEQRKIVNRILNLTITQAEAVYQQLYENQASLIRFLLDWRIPLPRSLQMAAEFALNTSIRKALEADEADLPRLNGLFGEATQLRIHLDEVSLAYVLKEKIEKIAVLLQSQPEEIALLRDSTNLVDLARSLPFETDIWKAQNIYFEMMEKKYPGKKKEAERGAAEAKTWVSLFAELGEKLSCRLGEGGGSP